MEDRALGQGAQPAAAATAETADDGAAAAAAAAAAEGGGIRRQKSSSAYTEVPLACAVCAAPRVPGARHDFWQCLTQQPQSLCDGCFGHRQRGGDSVRLKGQVFVLSGGPVPTEPRSPRHLLKLARGASTLNFICDSCDGIIMGLRFHCLDCLDFDLCDRCFLMDRAEARHDTTHQFLATPAHAPPPSEALHALAELNHTQALACAPPELVLERAKLSRRSVLDQLMEIEHACFGSKAWSSEGLREESDSDANKFVDVLRSQADDRLVGYIAFNFGDQGVCHIVSLAVLPTTQCRGLGSRLLTHAIQQARMRRDCRSMFLHVKVDNERALRLYTRFGFSIDAVIPKYYGWTRDPLDYSNDAYEMTLSLQ